MHTPDCAGVDAVMPGSHRFLQDLFRVDDLPVAALRVAVVRSDAAFLLALFDTAVLDAAVPTVSLSRSQPSRPWPGWRSSSPEPSSRP